MTLRDNITHGRAKDLWTGVSMSSPEAPLGRKARYGTVCEDRLISLACFGCRSWTAAAYKDDAERRMRTSRLTRLVGPKVVADGQFEAVLGKTRRTEF